MSNKLVPYHNGMFDAQVLACILYGYYWLQIAHSPYVVSNKLVCCNITIGMFHNIYRTCINVANILSLNRTIVRVATLWDLIFFRK